MWWTIAALIFGLCSLTAVVVFARRDGRQSALLEALKREIKDRERANKIVTAVRNMDDDTVRDRLRDISKK